MGQKRLEEKIKPTPAQLSGSDDDGVMMRDDEGRGGEGEETREKSSDDGR
jgi:hypothetical protein